MSSFKRRVTSSQPAQLQGTRIVPGLSTVVTSTGIPSLDDILGGGLPLTCSQLILAPDVHSAYGELVQKYFVAQGIAAGHTVIIVRDDAKSFIEECMWTPSSSAPAQASTPDEEDDESSKRHDTAIKIAWRYESMKQFRTTVSAIQSADDYCCVFDLTCRVPKSTIESATISKQIQLLNVSQNQGEKHVRQVLERISEKLESINRGGDSDNRPIRLCIPDFGSPQWDDIEPHEICYFLHALRAILRRHSNVCASVSLVPHMSSESWGGPGWSRKLGWLVDACISLSAFTGNLSLSAMFPSHHGFVHMYSLPMPSTLIPPSDKLSTLRGLTSSGENNLAFKCMRKRLIFETLHLDVEGGVGERRTTPAATISAMLDSTSHPGHSRTHEPPTDGVAAVQIQVEQVQQTIAAVSVEEKVSQASNTTSAKKPKQRKKVAFTSDRPDLYDF